MVIKCNLFFVSVQEDNVEKTRFFQLMSFSNPLSLHLGDVEINGSDVIANPDNLPLTLQQRY